MRPLLGTLVEIRACGLASRVTDGIAAAFAAIERVQRLMSFHDAGSDVSRINAAPVGRKVAVDCETYGVLSYAHELWRRSGGAFDIAIAPSLVSAGFLPSPPFGGSFPEPTSDDDVESAHFSDLELLPGRAVRWRKRGWIDLGGIAKGYAVDAAIEALRSHRVADAVVNAGGDLRCFGETASIHVRSPGRPTTAMLAVGALRDAAIATSAGYFSSSGRGECPIDPIVDPRLGRCIAWAGSISVVAKQCMAADALTKVVRLAPSSAPALLDHYEAQAVVVDEFGVRSCGRRYLQPDLPAARLPRGEVAVG